MPQGVQQILRSVEFLSRPPRLVGERCCRNHQRTESPRAGWLPHGPQRRRQMNASRSTDSPNRTNPRRATHAPCTPGPLIRWSSGRPTNSRAASQQAQQQARRLTPQDRSGRRPRRRVRRVRSRSHRPVRVRRSRTQSPPLPDRSQRRSGVAQRTPPPERGSGHDGQRGIVTGARLVPCRLCRPVVKIVVVAARILARSRVITTIFTTSG
jgi:hypothetical protein